MKIRMGCLALVTVLVVTASAVARAPSFRGIGDLPGGIFLSRPIAVSADGTVIVGESSSSFGNEAFRWTSAGGMQALGGLAAGNGRFESIATAVSADGSVVVGRSQRGGGLPPEGRAFRWTAAGGMQSLGLLPHAIASEDPNKFSGAYGISADGSVIVGQSGTVYGSQEAFRWTAGTGMEGLGDLGLHPDGLTFSLANAVSADGSTVVGSANGVASRWTRAGGTRSLGDPGHLLGPVQARAASADGSVIIGSYQTSDINENFYHEDFRWSGDAGFELLRSPGDDPVFRYDVALGISADGSTIVGVRTGREAYVWTSGDGVRSIRDVLVTDFGLDLSGWTLEVATAISADGTTIVGFGINPSGHDEAWVAVIPEPSACAAIATIAALLALRARRDKIRTR